MSPRRGSRTWPACTTDALDRTGPVRIIGGMEETESKPSWGSRIIAVLVLAVGAWILFKVVIGTVVAIAWAVAAIVAVIAVIWAIRTLT